MVAPFPAEPATVVCFCPACGRLGEHRQVIDGKMDCRHCGERCDIPFEEERLEAEDLEPETFTDT